MTTVLDRIVARRKERLSERKREVSFAQLESLVWEAPQPRDFRAALTAPRERGIAIIAEVKKASPSRGVIREDFRPLDIARNYAAGGAAAVSVLTEVDHFQGSDAYLREIASQVELPALRKDFIVDPYQVYEARLLGASAYLLIVDCLGDAELVKLLAVGRELGLAALVEVHRHEEAKRALDCGAEILGINNRDLRTFETRLETTIEIMAKLPSDTLVVSESGIFTREHLQSLAQAGAKAALIGESLMRETDEAAKLRELLDFPAVR